LVDPDKLKEEGKTLSDVADTSALLTRYYLCMTAISLQMKQILTCSNNMGYVLEKMEQV